MIHTHGEAAGVTAAQQAGIPFALLTLGTTSIERVAEVGPDTRKFFQLCIWKDRERALDLIQRAAAAGFEGLIVTVDVPVAGLRLRDERNGLTVPPSLTARTVSHVLRRPAWWVDLLTTEPLAFATLDAWPGTIA